MSFRYSTDLRARLSSSVCSPTDLNLWYHSRSNVIRAVVARYGAHFWRGIPVCDNHFTLPGQTERLACCVKGRAMRIGHTPHRCMFYSRTLSRTRLAVLTNFRAYVCEQSFRDVTLIFHRVFWPARLLNSDTQIVLSCNCLGTGTVTRHLSHVDIAKR